jgi:hypothetical protein
MALPVVLHIHFPARASFSVTTQRTVQHEPHTTAIMSATAGSVRTPELVTSLGERQLSHYRLCKGRGSEAETDIPLEALSARSQELIFLREMESLI